MPINLNSILKEQQIITQQLSNIRSELKHLPKDKFYCTRNEKLSKWYINNGSVTQYLPKKYRKKAEKLALRKFYLLLEEELVCRLKIIEDLINEYQKQPTESAKLLDPSSPYSELLQSRFQLEEDLVQWASEPYLHNKRYPENLIHKTFKGEFVRSKSEVIIANALYQNNIPYRYECELFLDGIAYYPDFTILHPRTMEIIYWEHFGCMDSDEYRHKTYMKLDAYGDFDIIPSINLITTFETREHPLDCGLVMQLVVEHFL